jgi:hypothetical protein
MVTKFEDLFGRFERGNLGEEEYQELLKNEMPNPSQGLENFCLPTESNRAGFAFSNNPYMKLMKSER